MIELEIANEVATLTLNRPDRHNSLVPEMLEEFLVALENIQADSNVRAVVLQANGRSFSTGGDLQGFLDHLNQIEVYAYTLVGLLNQVMLTFASLPIPVITGVHSQVTGGSMGFVLTSDIVLVTPNASFTPYYTVVGFSPDGGWTALLPSIIGSKRSTEILMCNHTINALEAVSLGLASRVVPAEMVREELNKTAQKVAAGQPGSVRRIKGLVNISYNSLATHLEAERTHFVEQISTAEAKRSMKAFLKNLRRSEAPPQEE